MGHFIEDAEQKEHELNKAVISSSQQQTEIQRENQRLYLPFHEEMVKLINKVAALSSESRKPVVEIGFTHLSGETNYEYFASSYKMIKIKKLLFFKKERVYYWWRRIIVEMANQNDYVIIKLHEKGTSESNIKDVIKKKLRTRIRISNLDSPTAITMLDYLGYRISAHELIKYLNSKPLQ